MLICNAFHEATDAIDLCNGYSERYRQMPVDTFVKHSSGLVLYHSNCRFLLTPYNMHSTINYEADNPEATYYYWQQMTYFCLNGCYFHKLCENNVSETWRSSLAEHIITLSQLAGGKVVNNTLIINAFGVLHKNGFYFMNFNWILCAPVSLL